MSHEPTNQEPDTAAHGLTAQRGVDSVLFQVCALEPITAEAPLRAEDDREALVAFGPGFDPEWGSPVLTPLPEKSSRPPLSSGLSAGLALLGIGLVAVALVLLLGRGTAGGEESSQPVAGNARLDLSGDGRPSAPAEEGTPAPSSGTLEPSDEDAPRSAEPRRPAAQPSPPRARPASPPAAESAGTPAAPGASGASPALPSPADTSPADTSPADNGGQPASAVPTLEQLLAGATNPERAGESTSPSAATRLTRSQVSFGLRQVAPAVRRCGEGDNRTVRVDLTIEGATGRVVTANVTGPDGATTTGSCISRAVRRASFPTFDDEDLQVRSFPFVL